MRSNSGNKLWKGTKTRECIRTLSHNLWRVVGRGKLLNSLTSENRKFLKNLGYQVLV